MTHDEIASAVADVMQEHLALALAPVLTRLAVAETQVAQFTLQAEAMSGLRDRMVTMETKAETPPAQIESIAVDLTPVLERVAAAEARLQTLGDLRDRVVTIETKTSAPLPPVDLGDVRDRLLAVEHRTPTREVWDALQATVSDLRAGVKGLEETEQKNAVRLEGYTSFLQRDASALGERVAALETRPLLPGPPGEPGAPGKDGGNGQNGAAGLSFEGVYQEGQTYEKGHLVTWAGSSWHCNESTATKPGDGSKAWTLMVKRGRDGRDGRDAINPVPVVAAR